MKQAHPTLGKYRNTNTDKPKKFGLNRALLPDPIEYLTARGYAVKGRGEWREMICPFHDDRHPSMKVDTRYYCFGCGAGSKDTTGQSDVIAFVQWVEQCGYVEAVKKLGDRVGISIERDPGLEKFYTYIKKEVEQAHATLLKHQELLDYLAKRGIGQEEVDRWMLGLRENRIIYPIRDSSNQICSFSSRRNPFIESDEPKYKNATNNVIYNRSRSLFGLNFAIKMLSTKNYFIIVEGYNDVIVLQKFGLPAVAVMGSVITEDQIELMKKYTTNVILFLDGDEAGIDGAHRSAKRLINSGFNVKIVVDFAGDPDEIALREQDNFYKWLNTKTMLYGQYIVSTMLSKYKNVVSDANIRLQTTFGKFINSVGFSDAEKDLYKKQIEEVIK